MDYELGLKFGKKFGNDLERYRIRYLFEGFRDDKVPLTYLRQLQNEDGGFPYNLERGKESSVNETDGILPILEELDLKNSDVCRKAVDYLSKVQGEDGSWDENIEIEKYNPPTWDKPGKLGTKMWLTADVCNHLISLSYRNSDAIRKATSFLLKHRDENGRFAGPKITTWIAIAVFGQLNGLHNEIVNKALNIVRRWVDDKADASFLNWYVECLIQGGLTKDNIIIQKYLNKLKTLQNKNGSWTSIDGERYTVPTTISILKNMKKLA